MMKRIYHDAIFYPREEQTLREMTALPHSEVKAKAIIVPHQDLRRAYNLYCEAFSRIKHAKRLIILSPLHSEVLLKDEGKFLFEGEPGTITTPLGEVRISHLGLDISEHYAEEEYAPELLLPYIASSFDSVETYIVYSAAKSAEESKKLSRLISKWNNEHTVFIISSNLTGRMDKETMLESRAQGAALIESGAHLMDLYRKGRISICGSAIIDALNRAITGNWHLIGLNQRDESTGHGAFYKELI